MLVVSVLVSLKVQRSPQVRSCPMIEKGVTWPETHLPEEGLIGFKLPTLNITKVSGRVYFPLARMILFAIRRLMVSSLAVTV